MDIAKEAITLSQLGSARVIPVSGVWLSNTANRTIVPEGWMVKANHSKQNDANKLISHHLATKRSVFRIIARAGPFHSYGYINKVYNCPSSILAALGGRYDGLLNGHHTLMTSAITLSITATRSRRRHQRWTVSRLPLMMVIDDQQAAGSYFLECLLCANVLDKFHHFLDIWSLPATPPASQVSAVLTILHPRVSPVPSITTTFDAAIMPIIRHPY